MYHGWEKVLPSTIEVGRGGVGGRAGGRMRPREVGGLPPHPPPPHPQTPPRPPPVLPLSPHMQVMPVELPGRNSRSREAPHTSMAALLAELLPGLLPLLAERPFALLGHSMGRGRARGKGHAKTHRVRAAERGAAAGVATARLADPAALPPCRAGAWVAYELACELQRRGGPLPARLYSSANRAPTLAGLSHDPDPVLMHALPPDQFWAAMERRYGPNPDLVRGLRACELGALWAAQLIAL